MFWAWIVGRLSVRESFWSWFASRTWCWMRVLPWKVSKRRAAATDADVGDGDGDGVVYARLEGVMRRSAEGRILACFSGGLYVCGVGLGCIWF